MNLLSIDIIATAPSDNSYVNKSRDGIRLSPMSIEQAKIVKNGQKWPNIEFLGKCQKNGVGIAWSIFLFTDIIATAPSDNIFVSKSRDGAKRLPMSRHKW